MMYFICLYLIKFSNLSISKNYRNNSLILHKIGEMKIKNENGQQKSDSYVVGMVNK